MSNVSIEQFKLWVWFTLYCLYYKNLVIFGTWSSIMNSRQGTNFFICFLAFVFILQNNLTATVRTTKMAISQKYLKVRMMIYRWVKSDECSGKVDFLVLTNMINYGRWVVVCRMIGWIMVISKDSSSTPFKLKISGMQKNSSNYFLWW